LAVEKAKLEGMQKAAREAGLPSSVYDPKIPVRTNRSNAGMMRYMRMQNKQH
jgi:hypothetical protein